jgi:CheY-like chemotaxis protein
MSSQSQNQRLATAVLPTRDAARILVVDDEPDILALLRHILSGAGYQVVVGYGGEDGLRKLARGNIDLILTDLSMPGVSGIELIEKAKTNPSTAHIPIIAVTAYVWDGMGQSAAEAGCDRLMAKPFRTNELLGVVDKYVGPARPKPPPLH